jgi:molecular chaperone Hsp33
MWVEDVLVRAISADGAVLACATIATGVAEEARARHGTLATATGALGRGLVAAAMLGSGLKGRQTVMLRVLGDGPHRPAAHGLAQARCRRRCGTAGDFSCDA